MGFAGAFLSRLLTVACLSVGLAGGVWGSLYSWPAAARESARAQVLVLGDSISAGYGIQREQGWVALLAKRLANANPRVDVANASISGETTGGGLARLPDLLKRHRPQLVIVELGGNDGLRGYPVARMQANLEAIVDLCLKSRAKVVLVGMEIPPNYGARYVNAFRGVFPTVARSRNVPLLPFLMRDVALDRRLMQRDGIHPTAAAQPKLLEAIWPDIKQALGHAR